MKKMIVGMALCWGVLAAGVGAEEEEEKGAAPATGAKQVAPKGARQIGAEGRIQAKPLNAGGMQAIQARGRGEAKKACEACEEAKARTRSNADATTDETTRTATCATCGRHWGVDADGNLCSSKCKDCLEGAIAGKKGKCEACKAKKGGANAPVPTLKPAVEE